MIAAQTKESDAEDSVAVLIRQARAGSQPALGELLERYRDYLLVIARSELDSDLRAKGGPSDLVQETFLEAQRDFQQFQGDDRDEIGRWLRELLRNNLKDFVRRQRRVRRYVGREQPLDAGKSDAPGLELPADQTSPSQRAIDDEREQQLREAIERLPPDYQQVILLRHIQKGSWAEVAAVMDRSVGAVQKLWMRALEQLRQQMPRQ